MAKLTNIQIYKHAQEKWDKANSDHQTKAAFVKFYEESRLEWLKLKYKDFEVTEAVRHDLRPFIRDVPFGKTATVRLNLAPSKVKYITGLHGDFTFECNGKQTVRTLPIVPREVDSVAKLLSDPFNRPDDTEPIYVEQNDGSLYLDILSTNWPDNVWLHYIKEPEPYALLSDPNGYTEEEQQQQFEIIDIAVKKYDLSIENFGRFQGMREEITASGA